MISEKIGFIGGGNMARSLIGGLIARGVAKNQLLVSEPAATAREMLASQLGVAAVDDSAQVARASEVLILAVKPQILHDVITTLASSIRESSPLIVSIAAGIRTRDMQRWLGGLPVVRAMPNSPALTGCGVTALFATQDVNEGRRLLAQEIMAAVGPALWVEKEQDMDAVTAVSGSGPAYFFLLIEMLEAAGIAQGLKPDVARRLAVETAYGAGQMARASNESPATLREQVTSKGGTTEAALKHLESAQVRAIFNDAVAAAAKRSAELADQLGSKS